MFSRRATSQMRLWAALSGMTLLPTLTLSLFAYWLTLRSIEQWAETVAKTTLDAAERVTAALEQSYTLPLTEDLEALVYNRALYRAFVEGNRDAVLDALQHLSLDEADAVALYNLHGERWVTHPADAELPHQTNEFLPSLDELRDPKEEVIISSVPVKSPTGGLTLSEWFLCAYPLFDDETPTFRGVAVVAKHLPFSRVVSREREEIVFVQKRRARDRALTVLLMAGGCVIAVAFVVSHWLSRRLARPVEMLLEGTREIARGNLDYRVEEPPTPELAQLARAFNHMAGELRNQQNALRRMEKSQAWQEVAQKLAHELKNPLTPIQLSAQRLRRRYYTNREGFEELLNQCTEVIERQVNSLKTLLDEFSRLARLPEPNRISLPLKEVLERVLALFPELEGESVRVERDLPEDLPPLYADEEQIQRVFYNLIKNALEAMPQGGTLTLNAKQKENLLEISIDDTGTGIDSEVRERLFLPHVSTKREGHGLGLAIVRKIVEDHGGNISLEPHPSGVGTRAILLLPTA